MKRQDITSMILDPRRTNLNVVGLAMKKAAEKDLSAKKAAA